MTEYQRGREDLLQEIKDKVNILLQENTENIMFDVIHLLKSLK